MLAINNMVWETVDEMDLAVASRLRTVRKRKKMSQAALAEISGVSLGSLKRFEASGEISLKSLTKLAVVLDCSDDIRGIFSRVPYASIEEVIRENR